MKFSASWLLVFLLLAPFAYSDSGPQTPYIFPEISTQESYDQAFKECVSHSVKTVALRDRKLECGKAFARWYFYHGQTLFPGVNAFQAIKILQKKYFVRSISFVNTERDAIPALAHCGTFTDLPTKAACYATLQTLYPQWRSEIDPIRVSTGHDAEAQCVHSGKTHSERLLCQNSIFRWVPELSVTPKYPSPNSGKEADLLEANCESTLPLGYQRYLCLLPLYEWWRDVGSYYRTYNTFTNEQRRIIDKMVLAYPHAVMVRESVTAARAESDLKTAREREDGCDALPAGDEKYNCLSGVLEYWHYEGGGLVSWNSIIEKLRVREKLLDLDPKDIETILFQIDEAWSLDVDLLLHRVIKDLTLKPLEIVKKYEPFHEESFDFYNMLFDHIISIVGTKRIRTLGSPQIKRIYLEESKRILEKMKSTFEKLAPTQSDPRVNELAKRYIAQAERAVKAASELPWATQDLGN